METVYPKTLILGCWMSTFLLSCATLLSPPDPSRYVLPQGALLLVEEVPSASLVSVNLFIRGGSSQEQIPGTAHLLEHLFFRKNNMTDLQYAQQIHQFGGSTSAQTSYDYTNYSQLVPKESFEATLTLLLQHLSEFQCTSALLAEEKPVLLTEIQSRLDRPDLSLTDRMLDSVLTASVPEYHSPAGTSNSLAQLTPEILQHFFEDSYRGENWILSIAGNVKMDAVAQQVKQFLQESSKISSKKISAKSRSGWRWRCESAPTFRYGAGILLPPFSHPDRPALLVAERYLEWFLREYLLHDFQIKTSVDISSFYLKSAGAMIIRLSGGKSTWIHSEFFCALNAVCQEVPALSLVEAIKHFLVVQHEKKIEDIHTLAFALGESEVLGNYRYFTELPKYLSQVTPEEVQRVLQIYLSRDNLHFLLLDPQPHAFVSPVFKAQSDPPVFQKKQLPAIRKKKILGRVRGGSAFPEHQQNIVLPNGFKVILRHRPNASINTVGLFFKAGSAYEANSLGEASCLETYFEDRVYRSEKSDLRRSITHLGGDFDWKRNLDLFWLEGSILPANTIDAISFLAQAMQAPQRNDRVSLDRVRQERAIQWRLERETLFLQGKQAVLPLLFPQHSYGKKPVDPQSFSQISFEALHTFYQQHFIADRASVVVVGDFEEEVILKEIRRCFEGWPKASNRVPEIPSVPLFTATKAQETQQDTSFEQSFLFFGVPVCAFGEADHLPLLVLQGILNHRLFQKLVYEKSIAYQTLALGDFYAMGGFLGLVVLVPPTQEALAKIQLHDIIASLKQNEVSLKELQQVKKQLLVSQQIHYRTGRNLLQGLGIVSLLPTVPPSHLQDILEQVTAQQILHLTQKYFSSPQWTWLHLKGKGSR